MPDTKITALATGTVVDTAADWLVYVDVSDTSMAASGTDKKVSLATLAAALSPTALGAIGATTLLGNPTGSSASPSAITLGVGLAFSGSTLTVAGGGGGSGTVTTVSVVTANGVSGSVANATTTPAITLTLGDITPTSVAATGTVTGSNLSNTNTGDQTFASLSPLTTLGDLLIYTTVNTRLAGNITTSKLFLTQTGAGASSAAPVWAAIAGADLPNPSATTLGGVQSKAATTNQFLTSISTSGVPASAQPAFTDISGTVAATQLPNPSASTLGGIRSAVAVSNQWINSISTGGVPSLSQPAFSNLSGTATVAQLPTTGLVIGTHTAPITTDTDGATITFDLSLTDWHVVTLGGNRTLALANAATGQVFYIKLIQDATGSRTVTWFGGITWFTSTFAAPTLPTGAAKAILLCFRCTGAGAYDGFVVGASGA
jgi:hypothetical protein